MALLAIFQLKAPSAVFPKLLKAMEVFLGALCITGALGFLVGLLVGTCSTLFLMAGKTIRDPEVHPVSEETDEVSKGSQVCKGSQTSQSYALDKARSYVERPQSLPETSEEPQEVPEETEDRKEEVPGPQASQDCREVGKDRIFLLPGHLAIQGGWSITAKTCRRLIQPDTYVMRRPCSECGYASGQRLLSQPDRVFYTGPPSEVYHRLRECGKLKCARHIKVAQNCQCEDCWAKAHQGE